MHRLILDLTNEDKIQVDHIYHNKNDNRKSMLRLATNAQNSMNKKCAGVYWRTEKQKWVAEITIDKVKHLKYFNSFDDAKQQRLEYEKEYFKEFAYKAG
jgi:hypothetical protein